MLDEVYQSKKEKSADTDSAESQVILESCAFPKDWQNIEPCQPFECCEASKYKRQRKIDARHQKEKVGANISISQSFNFTMFQFHCHQVMFYLGVAYAANIGGTGTLTASEPNVIMKGILDEKFPCQV